MTEDCHTIKNKSSSIATTMPTRPGVEAAVRLTKLVSEPSIWSTIESKYDSMLVAKKGGNQELLELDKKCEELGRKLRRSLTTMMDIGNNEEREKEGDEENKETYNHKENDDKENNDSLDIPCVSREDLFTIMKWKFSKGKSRPLWKYLNSNTEESVQRHSKASFQIASRETRKDDHGDDSICNTNIISESIKEMCKLSGVGPASSSAILSLLRPDLFVFMDDEVIECLHKGKREYTLKVYLNINDKCQTIATQLGEGWDVRRVGRALWTAATIPAYSDEEDLTLSKQEKNEVVGKSCNDTKSNAQVKARQSSKRRRTS